MFTALNTNPETVHRGRRKIISERVRYQNGEFYLSRLLSGKEDNEKFIKKFINECRFPVVTGESAETLEIKYKIMLNTLIRYADKNTDIAFFDPQGKLCFLLEGAVKNFRSVFAVSQSPDYNAFNEILLSRLGACAVIKENISDINGCNYIISSERLPFSAGPYIFGEHGWFVNGCKPIFNCAFPSVLPDFADVFSVAAGICKYIGDEAPALAYCTKFSLKGVKADAENFFK